MNGGHTVDLGTRFVDACRGAIGPVEGGTIGQVTRMLDQGVNVNSRGFMQCTGLIVASAYGYRALVILLIGRGAEVNAVDPDIGSALAYASSGGHVETAEILYIHGADLHYVNLRRWSSLHYAAFRGRLPMCEFLLSKGIDLLALNNEGHTALDIYGDAGFDSGVSGYSCPRYTPEAKALCCAALEAAWAAGPHPSQVQRRRDERWFRRGPLLIVLAEHAYRPLQLRALAIALAAASLDPAAPIEAVALTTKEQRHAFLLGRVFSNEGIVRLLIALL